MAGEEIIKIVDVVKAYGMGEVVVNALDGVDLTIHKGEYVAIIGPSGSGKSTLMNILGCLDRPTSGKYILDGKDVSSLRKAESASIRNEKIGFVFQSYNLLARVTALENVMLPMTYSRNHRSGRGKKERAMELLELVGLKDRMHHVPSELSGGQQQRVSIARALVNDPVLILADEPTGNLDTHSSKEILGLFDDLHEKGRTIILVTHDKGVAERTERVVLIRDGKVVSDEYKNGNGKEGQVSYESV